MIQAEYDLKKRCCWLHIIGVLHIIGMFNFKPVTRGMRGVVSSGMQNADLGPQTRWFEHQCSQQPTAFLPLRETGYSSHSGD